MPPPYWSVFVWGYKAPFFSLQEVSGLYVSGLGSCRTLLDVSLICFVVSLLLQSKHILGLADQRAHASTFECVRLCSEGKIGHMHVSLGRFRFAFGLTPLYGGVNRVKGF